MTKAQIAKLSTSLSANISSLNLKHKTKEEISEEQYQLFQTDACVTVISAVAAMVTETATHLCDMVEFSSRSEKRAKYGIMRDYTTSRDSLSACASIRREVRRQNSATNDIIRLLSRNTRLFNNISQNSDAGIDFISRVDASDAEFAKDYKAIRCQLTDMMRAYKPQDPIMLYAIVNLVYLAKRFDAIARYVSGFAYGMRPGEPLNPILHLKIVPPLCQLLNRLQLTDKQGRTFHFLVNKEDIEAWQRTTARKSWQKQHAQNPPVVISLYEHFQTDALVRLAWQMEIHMFEIRTIDRLIAASEGHDPEYRKDYRQKRLQSCASTYEQAMLNQTVILCRWHELPQRMRAFIDSINARPCIDKRRRPKPVVSFKLEPCRDARGNIIRQRNGDPEFKPTFCGIWNSAYEAEAECGVKWQKIRRSADLKAVNDGTNHIWLSIEDYISMTHHSLLATRPDVAAEFARLLPEFDMRTPRQIAEETRAQQGSFNEAAKPVA